MRKLVTQALHDLRQASADEVSSNVASAPDLGDLPELAGFRRGEFRPRSDPPAQVMRISASPEASHPGLEAWLPPLRQWLDEEAPVLLLAPLSPGADWIDVIAGKPSPGDFFCLRDARLPRQGSRL